MSTLTRKKYIEHTDPHSFIELLKEFTDQGWRIVDITITPGNGFNSYKADFEMVEMG